MATIKEFANGKVAIQCPKCGHLRDVKDFRGNPDREDGWFSKCKPCRNKRDMGDVVGKPHDADWDDKAKDCEFCGGSGWYNYEQGQPCFRCANKGFQTWRDMARNISYDEFRAYQAMKADMSRAKQEENQRTNEDILEEMPF